MSIAHKCRLIFCYVVALYLFDSTETIFCCNKQQYCRVIDLQSTDNNPLSYVWLKDAQDEDQKSGELCTDPSSGFHKKNFAGEELIFLRKRITPNHILFLDQLSEIQFPFFIRFMGP